MKKIIFIVTFISILTFYSCKKERNKSMIVVTDCTGTYLRFEGKDYKVCNLEKVVLFDNGDTVTATFKKIQECNGSGNFSFTCKLYHIYESWIEVQEIK